MFPMADFHLGNSITKQSDSNKKKSGSTTEWLHITPVATYINTHKCFSAEIRTINNVSAHLFSFLKTYEMAAIKTKCHIKSFLVTVKSSFLCTRALI